ncbi:MAG: endonuclease MutS2, partial [Anaerolineae bacterium]
MNDLYLSTLEYPKILHALATHTSFSAGEDRARELVPTADPEEIERRLETTSEARAFLKERPGVSVGGAHDLQPLTSDAERGKVLAPADLLDVRDTLAAARTLQGTLSRLG